MMQHKLSDSEARTVVLAGLGTKSIMANEIKYALAVLGVEPVSIVCKRVDNQFAGIAHVELQDRETVQRVVDEADKIVIRSFKPTVVALCNFVEPPGRTASGVTPSPVRRTELRPNVLSLSPNASPDKKAVQGTENEQLFHAIVADALQSHDKVVRKQVEELAAITAAADMAYRTAKLHELMDQRSVFVGITSRLKNGDGASVPLSEPEKLRVLKRELDRLQAQLPVFAKRLEIETHLSSIVSRFTVIKGPRASGKSTQIPQYAADMPCFAGKRVICSQPQDPVATSLAARVAYEYSGGDERATVGGDVGFRVGGLVEVSARTRIEYVAEDVLLDMLARARRGVGENPFEEVGCVIVDDADRQSINTDSIVTSLKENYTKWRHVKVAVMSATNDADQFSVILDNAPIVEISPRQRTPPPRAAAATTASPLRQSSLTVLGRIENRTDRKPQSSQVTEDQRPRRLFFRNQRTVHDRHNDASLVRNMDDAKPPPVPVTQRTVYCHICMDDDPIEDNFYISGCNHAYCRASIRQYILDRIALQDLTPKCPCGDCTTVISDGDLTMVLTVEEQQRYYDASKNKAVALEPTIHKCLEEGCRGVVSLPLDDPHFVCPLCGVERCVQCNTRAWHEGLTCEQARQRGIDSELHPQQLRDMYGGQVVYQCARCSFGPIEHQYCHDLRTHQHEAVGNARINNACPKCGWFAGNLSAWPRWNGEMPAQVTRTRQRDLQNGESPDDAAVRRHAQHVREHLLNLKCPKCDLVFVDFDFDSCAALTCANPSCAGGICAYCLAECGDDAHAHVRTCDKNPNRPYFYTTEAEFHAVHKTRREGLVSNYLKDVVKREEGGNMVQRVKAALTNDFRSLGLDIAAV